jgi:hypothetical protein
MKTNIRLVFYSTFFVWTFFACSRRNMPNDEGHDNAGPGTVNREESVSRDDYGRDEDETNTNESDSEYQQRISSKKHEQGNTTGDNGTQKKSDQ